MKINLYLENKNNLIQSEDIDNITGFNLDVVRTRVIKYLTNENILDVKYKVSLTKSHKTNLSEIDIIFEKDISLLRELKLKKIFND